MRGAVIIGISVLGLVGCAGGAPSPAAMPLALLGPVELVRAGQSFIADLQPGPVLTVSRDPVFGNFEGKLAKDVAEQFCASRRSRLDSRTYGHFVAGTWVFKGGCA